MEENNNVNNIKKKKPILSIVSLTILAVLVLVGTYAYWQVTEKQTNRNLVGSACLSITFSNETGDIDLENMWPTSDSEGAALTPYTFTLTNTCPDELVAYTVAIEEIKDDSENPITYPTDYLSDTNLKIKFDNLAPVKISTLDNLPDDDEDDYDIYKTKKIINRKLAGGESRTHSVRLWLDANAPETEMNKFFLSKIKIIAGQGIEEECYAVNSEGLLYAYDPDCGRSATIPATVGENQVKAISSTAFKGSRTRIVPNINVYDYYLYDEKDGDQAKANAKINSIQDFQDLSGICDSRTNAQCEVDFSIAFTGEFGAIIQSLYDGQVEQFMQEHNLTSEEDLIAYINDHFTENDMFVVIYYTGSDADKLNAIRTRAAQSDYFNIANALGWDINYYDKGSEPTPASGLYEYYYSLNYYAGDGYGDRDLGWSEPGEGTTTETISGLMINSLDLSQATNLERIDALAFSNMAEVEDLSTYQLSVPTGLTSLTFGNNSKAIDLRACAFAGANLDDLTIYNTLTYYKDVSFTGENTQASLLNGLGINSSNPNDILLIYGAFYESNINNLTIKQAGSSTSFSGVPVDIQISGQTHRTGLSIFNGLGDHHGVFNNVTIDNGITEIGDYAFEYATINNINWSNNLTAIGNNAFWNYSGLSLTLPNTLVTIGKEAFRNWQSGAGGSLVIPGSVTTIGEDAFYQYKGDSITFNEGLVTIEDSAFSRYQGADVHIPSTIRNLGDCIFNEFRDGHTIYINMTQADFNTLVNGTFDNSAGLSNMHFLDS